MAVFNEVIAMLIRADTRGAVGPLQKLEGQATQTANAWDKAGKRIGVSGAQLKSGLSGLATSAAVTGIAAGIKQAADAYVAAAQGASMLSKVTNATVEDASRFNAVASQMGLEMNDLVEIFADFQQATAKSPQGLAQLGVELTKNSRGQTDWVATAQDFMTAVQGIGDATQRNTLMFQYFGEEGAKQLMGLLNAGQSLEQAMGNVSESLIIHAEDVKAANDYAKALTDMKGAASSLSQTVGESTVPALTEFMQGLTDVIELSNKWDTAVANAGGQDKAVNWTDMFHVFSSGADDTAAAVDNLNDKLGPPVTSMEALTATIASGATSGQAFADAVARAGGELAAQAANASLAAQALDVYRASTDQAYEATLNLLSLDAGERSAQRAAEGAADSAADAKANMDKALADAKAAKTVVENIAAIRGRERKKVQEEGIVAGSTDVREIEGIKGRAAQKKTRVTEAAGVITPAEARQIREATRQYEQSLDDISAAWIRVGQARVAHLEALGKYLTPAEKLDQIRQALAEGLKIPGLSAAAKKDIKADLAEVTKSIQALGGVPVTIDNIKFKEGTTKAELTNLQNQIRTAGQAGNQAIVDDLSAKLAALKVEGGAATDLKLALGLDPASVAASQAALANIGIDPKTGKPYTAQTVAKVDKTQAQKDLDALTKPRTVTVTVNMVPGAGGLPSPLNLGPVPGRPAARLNFSSTPQAVSFNPTIVSNYPKPERTSDSIASALRTAKYVVGL